MELTQESLPMTAEEVAAAVAMDAEAIPLNETSPEVELFVSVEDSASPQVLDADAYFVEPIAPPAPPAQLQAHLPTEPSTVVPVHPAVEEIKQQMQGLTAEEIMAGMLPELSRLYRINGELNEAIAELRETQATLTDAIADRDNTIARTYEEVSGAYIAGQAVERELGRARADLILLRTELTVAVTQRDSHLNDLHVISSMLREILTRTANIQDVASHNEYYNALSRRTAIELVKELVGQATDPRDTTQSFVKRVAACRSNPMQGTDGGSNEQDSGTA